MTDHFDFRGGLQRAMFAVLIAFGLLLPAEAQVDTGSIVGTVTDAAGAVVPDAKVTVREENTGITQSVTTSKSGSYTISPLKLGTYTLSVEREGFKTTARQHIEVTIQSRLEVNIPLEVGAVTQTVQVESTTPLLETQSSAIQQLVESRAINDLPLNGRNAAFLAQISPGVTFAQNDHRGLQNSGSFTANGLKRTQNNYLLDGMDNNVAIGDLVNQSQYVVMPPPDALREFTVQTSNYSAEFGHSAGAVLNVSTKAGTNKFHGNIWWYVRNDLFDAREYFAKEELGPKPKFRRNQFGGTFGGPIWHDHTFFFMDYQGTREVQGQTYTTTVPTKAERAIVNGSAYTDLNDLITLQLSNTAASATKTDALGRKFRIGTVFDPTSTRKIPSGGVDPVTGLAGTPGAYIRDPFYDGSLIGKTDYTDSASIALLNHLPSARFNHHAVDLLNLYPEPTNGEVQNNSVTTPNNTNNVNSFDTRLDHQITSKDSAFVRYSYVYVDQKNPGPFPGLADGATARPGTGYTESQNGALSWTHIISPHLVNEARIGYSRVFDKRLQPGAGTQGIPDDYGIPGVPQLDSNGGLPLFQIGTLHNLGASATNPSDKASNVLQATENLSIDRNKHQIRVGFEFQKVAYPMATPSYPRGMFNHSGSYTSVTTSTDGSTGRAQFVLEPQPSPYDPALNYLGGANQVRATDFPPAYYPIRHYIGAYIQDSWRVTQKFTLNAGLRYEFVGAPAERDGRLGNLVSAYTGDTEDGLSHYYFPRKRISELLPSVANLLTANGIVVTPVDDFAINIAPKDNFAPRVGFNLQPLSKMSIRGGYGLFYQANENHGISNSTFVNFPFQVSVNTSAGNSVTPLTTDGSIGPLSQGLQNISLSPDSVNPALLTYNGEPRHVKTTYSQAYSLQVQYQLTPSTLFFIGYVGSNSRHVQLTMPTNTTNAIHVRNTNAKSISFFKTMATGGTYISHKGGINYNSLQFGAERRFRNGWAFTANMTWGKCMGNVRDLLDNGEGGLRAPYVPGAGPSLDYSLCDIDVRRIVHTTGSYELPFGKGKRFLQHGIAAALAGGWSANWIFTAQDGQPFNVNCSITTTTSLGCFAVKKPGVPLYTKSDRLKHFVNADAFEDPPIATSTLATVASLGGSPGQVTGPEFRRLDFSIFRRFNFIRETYFQFRAEAFNLTNTPSFGQPGSLNYASSAFASISSVRNSPNNQRELQFVAKYYF